MNSDIPPRLRWACRRGMLELDVMLGYFLDEAYVHLSEEDKARFVELLSSSDQDLFYWLTGKQTAPNPELALIVEKIRQHAQTRDRSSTL